MHIAVISPLRLGSERAMYSAHRPPTERAAHYAGSELARKGADMTALRTLIKEKGKVGEHQGAAVEGYVWGRCAELMLGSALSNESREYQAVVSALRASVNTATPESLIEAVKSNLSTGALNENLTKLINGLF